MTLRNLVSCPIPWLFRDDYPGVAVVGFLRRFSVNSLSSNVIQFVPALHFKRDPVGLVCLRLLERARIEMSLVKAIGAGSCPSADSGRENVVGRGWRASAATDLARTRW